MNSMIAQEFSVLEADGILLKYIYLDLSVDNIKFKSTKPELIENIETIKIGDCLINPYNMEYTVDGVVKNKTFISLKDWIYTDIRKITESAGDYIADIHTSKNINSATFFRENIMILKADANAKYIRIVLKYTYAPVHLMRGRYLFTMHSNNPNLSVIVNSVNDTVGTNKLIIRPEKIGGLYTRHNNRMWKKNNSLFMGITISRADFAPFTESLFTEEYKAEGFVKSEKLEISPINNKHLIVYKNNHGLLGRSVASNAVRSTVKFKDTIDGLIDSTKSYEVFESTIRYFIVELDGVIEQPILNDIKSVYVKTNRRFNSILNKISSKNESDGNITADITYSSGLEINQQHFNSVISKRHALQGLTTNELHDLGKIGKITHNDPSTKLVRTIKIITPKRNIAPIINLAASKIKLVSSKIYNPKPIKIITTTALNATKDESGKGTTIYTDDASTNLIDKYIYAPQLRRYARIANVDTSINALVIDRQFDVPIPRGTLCAIRDESEESHQFEQVLGYDESNIVNYSVGYNTPVYISKEPIIGAEISIEYMIPSDKSDIHVYHRSCDPGEEITDKLWIEFDNYDLEYSSGEFEQHDFEINDVAGFNQYQFKVIFTSSESRHTPSFKIAGMKVTLKPE